MLKSVDNEKQPLRYGSIIKLTMIEENSSMFFVMSEGFTTVTLTL